MTGEKIECLGISRISVFGFAFLGGVPYLVLLFHQSAFKASLDPFLFNFSFCPIVISD